MKFYKVLKKDLIHNGFQFKEGLNIDVHPFNPGWNTPGGFCYSREGILQMSSKGVFIAEVTVPDDAVTVEQQYPYECTDLSNVFKSDKIILGKPELISPPLVDRLIAEGADTRIITVMLEYGHHTESCNHLISLGYNADLKAVARVREVNLYYRRKYEAEKEKEKAKSESESVSH